MYLFFRTMEVITHARVKYRDNYDDNLIEFVPISDVKEFQLKIPKDITDFDKKKYYSVKYTDAKNPDGIYLPAQISQFACK